MYIHVCLYTQQESRFDELQRVFSFPLPVAQVELKMALPASKGIQKDFTVKLCRAKFLHAVVDMLQEGSSSNSQVSYK